MIVVWKESKVAVNVAQARRLRCAHCLEPFTYLAVERHEGLGLGVPLLSSNDAMGRRAFDEAAGIARDRVARGRVRGEGRCPSCERLQPRMVLSIFARSVPSLLGTLGVTLVIGIICVIFLGMVHPTLGTGAFLLAAAGIPLAWVRQLVRDSFAATPLERSRSDEALLHDLGPGDLVRRWAEQLDLHRTRAVLLCAGLVDEAGGLEVPAALDPVACLEAEVRAAEPLFAPQPA